MDWGLIVYSYFPFIWVARVARLVFISWMIPFIIWYKLKHNKRITQMFLCKSIKNKLNSTDIRKNSRANASSQNRWQKMSAKTISDNFFPIVIIHQQAHFRSCIKKYHDLYHYDDILENPIRITEIRSKIINGD